MNRNSSLLQALLDLVARLRTPAPPPEPAPVDFSVLAPLQPRVLMIVYNPVVDSSGRRLVQTLGWNDPVRLAQEFMADIQECSGGLVNYRIVQRIDVDEIPVKIDGFQYRIADYMNNMRRGGGFHDPDTVNYLAVVERFDLLNRVARDELDEVWLFGGPFFGFYESTMAGAGAFFCNAPTVSGTEGGSRRFIIMGYNYERGVGEMLEDLGHRAESMLRVVYRNTRGAANLFERYALYNQVAPGQANVGLLHFAPNSVRDYDWANPTPVPSCCDDWFFFPNLPEPPNYRKVAAREWGNGDIRLHHKWWFKHLPKVAGDTNGIANAWWKYVVDPNLVV